MIKETGETRVYIDLEYCYPGMTETSGRPTDSDKRQVVQIAAIVFDDAGNVETDTYNQIVVPKYTNPLPSFFTELTGITQEQVDEMGVEFEHALKGLVVFCRNRPIYTFHKDWEVLRQNCSYDGLPFPFRDRPFYQVKELLPEWGIDPDAYSSGTLFRAAGLDMQGHVHDALHDVRSMAAAVHHFEHLSGA